MNMQTIFVRLSLRYKFALTLSGLLLVALLTADFLANRSEISLSAEFSMPALPDTEAATGYPPLAERAQLQAYFELFKQPEITEQEPVATVVFERLSEQEQAQQQGVRRFLYVGNMRYEVFGIYHVHPAFVTLNAKNLDTNKTQFIRLHEQESLGPYRIEAISTRGVEFKANQSYSVLLQLYLPTAQLNTGDKSDPKINKGNL